MKVAVLSDAHIDVNSHIKGENLFPILIDSLKKKEPDLIIIAGDLSNFAEETVKIINIIEREVGVPLLFVPGNHDIWVEPTESSWDSYKLFAEHHSTLINKPYHINDEYVVIGDMGWYDYSFAPDTIPQYKIRSRKKSLWADSTFALWGMEDTELMEKMLETLKMQLEENKNKKVIFVNHFVPYKDFITYKTSEPNWNLCNGFIGSENLGELIDKYSNVEYVIFGHTHKRYGLVENYKGKNFICNPVGYVGEWETEDFATELEKTITVFDIN